MYCHSLSYHIPALIEGLRRLVYPSQDVRVTNCGGKKNQMKSTVPLLVTQSVVMAPYSVNAAHPSQGFSLSIYVRAADSEHDVLLTSDIRSVILHLLCLI